MFWSSSDLNIALADLRKMELSPCFEVLLKALDEVILIRGVKEHCRNAPESSALERRSPDVDSLEHRSPDVESLERHGLDVDSLERRGSDVDSLERLGSDADSLERHTST
jgi:hypothetical protein